MLNVHRHTQFKRDAELARRRGKDMGKLRALMALLIHEMPLPANCRDHALRGPWQGFREAHIESDWLLIYRVTDGAIIFARTGTHADLFGE